MDEPLARSAFDPEAVLTMSFIKTDGSIALRNMKMDDYFKSWPKMKEDGTQLEERIWNEVVQTNGLAGTVWTDYSFYLNGEYHHCGINSFNVLKTSEGWKISNAISTSQEMDCSKEPANLTP